MRFACTKMIYHGLSFIHSFLGLRTAPSVSIVSMISGLQPETLSQTSVATGIIFFGRCLFAFALSRPEVSDFVEQMMRIISA